jgi:hypothetical protein
MRQGPHDEIMGFLSGRFIGPLDLGFAHRRIFTISARRS